MDFNKENKMNYDDIEHVYYSMFMAFHPQPLQEFESDNNEIVVSPEFSSIWTLFLKCSGWTEDEFADQMELMDAMHDDAESDLSLDLEEKKTKEQMN